MATRYDKVISSEEEKKEEKKPNRFAQSIASLKGSSELSSSEEVKTEDTHETEDKPVRPHKSEPEVKQGKVKAKKEKTDTEEVPYENPILDELFPKGAKEKNFNAHSLYLSDSQWKKIQKIAKEQNISCSAVVSKILDKVL